MSVSTWTRCRALYEATSPARSWTTGSKPKRKFAGPKKKKSTNADFCAGLASKSNALTFCSEACNDSEVRIESRYSHSVGVTALGQAGLPKTHKGQAVAGARCRLTKENAPAAACRRLGEAVAWFRGVTTAQKAIERGAVRASWFGRGDRDENERFQPLERGLVTGDESAAAMACPGASCRPFQQPYLPVFGPRIERTFHGWIRQSILEPHDQSFIARLHCDRLTVQRAADAKAILDELRRLAIAHASDDPTLRQPDAKAILDELRRTTSRLWHGRSCPLVLRVGHFKSLLCGRASHATCSISPKSCCSSGSSFCRRFIASTCQACLHATSRNSGPRWFLAF